MAFMQVGSTNKNFSFMLRKNPSSGMLVRSLKEGHLFGYYSNAETVFNCFFKDSDWSVSYKRFKDESFEYVNPTRFNAPEFVLDTISEFLAHIIKKEDKDDVAGYYNFVTINMISIKKKYLDIFQKYFTNVILEAEEICPNNFKLKFSNTGTLKEILSFVQLFAIFNILKSRRLTEDEITKYMNQLINIKAPYFIKYVFKVNILNSPKLFRQHKAALEANSFEKIEFDYGYASLQRINAVERLISFERDIVDLGCGEGNFVKHFLPKLKDHKYWAIDTNQEMLDIVAKRARGAENLEMRTHWLGTQLDPVDIICSEVIEHMEKDEATKFIQETFLRGGDTIKSMVLTTPNKDFNQFYFFEDDEVRHEDHHFEMGMEEFKEWVAAVAHTRPYEIFEIGDKVNGICCTLGAKIS